MSYSIKKAGVAFKTKLGTNSDLTGEAANFSAYFIADADGVKTDVVAAFAEDATKFSYFPSLSILMKSSL